MEHRIVSVSGMTCGGCAKKIERNLGKLDGVDAVEAKVSDEAVNITFDPGAVTYDNIKQAIRDSGYGVVEQQTEKPSLSCSCCK